MPLTRFQLNNVKSYQPCGQAKGAKAEPSPRGASSADAAQDVFARTAPTVPTPATRSACPTPVFTAQHGAPIRPPSLHHIAANQFACVSMPDVLRQKLQVHLARIDPNCVVSYSRKLLACITEPQRQSPVHAADLELLDRIICGNHTPRVGFLGAPARPFIAKDTARDGLNPCRDSSR